MSNIHRIYSAHTFRSVALSLIGIYVPIYLLTLGYSLQEVLLFYVTTHICALIVGFVIVAPLLKRYGPIFVLKLSFPVHVIFLSLLLVLPTSPLPLFLIAFLNGSQNMSYWMPLNVLFLKHSEQEKMGDNLGKFFALPKFFGIAGPLLSALLIPFFGFGWVFIFSIIGLGISYLPLFRVETHSVTIALNFQSSWKRFRKNKTLFILEGLDNIIEESEWFWGIYVYLLIGSLATPGIVGALESIGGAIFTVFVGKYANHHAKKLIPFSAFLLIMIMTVRIFITDSISAFGITLIASFVMTLFLVSYFSSIYKTVKGDDEEEFILLREIPTVLGRLIMFGGIFLTLDHLQLFFVTPIIFTVFLLILYFWKHKYLKG
jgi:MFS family permease